MKYQELCNFEIIYTAYLAARKGKRSKFATAQFEANALERVEQIVHLLERRIYRPGEFEVFRVTEPKPRLVQAPAFRDKVVQHAIVDNFLYEAITQGFIFDNYASQKGRGVHFGLDRLSKFFTDYWNKHRSTEGWVLKCDVKSFFASIDHEILKEKVAKKVEDPEIFALLCTYIDSTEGLPLGYQTSQMFALLYLDEFDHFVKERLKIKYYGRYMDDFYLISEDKEHLKYCLKVIRHQMAKLKLELNGKTNIFPLRNGIDFLGFHTYLTESGKVLRKVRRSSIKRMKAKVKRWAHAYPKGEITKEEILACWQAWDNHASHGNTFTLRQKVRRQVEAVLGERIPPKKSRWENRHTEYQKAKITKNF